MSSGKILALISAAMFVLAGCSTAPSKPAPTPQPKPAAKEKPAKTKTKIIEAAPEKPAQAKAAPEQPKPGSKIVESTAAPPAKKAAKVQPAKVKAPAKPKEAKKPAPPAKPKAPKPKKPAPQPAPFKPLGQIAAKSWPVAGANDASKWVVQKWANPATIESQEGKGIKVVCAGGSGDKSCIGLRVRGDLSSRRALVLDVTNPQAQSIPLAIAVMTTKGDKYFESQALPIKPGQNKDVTFDLTAKRYKSKGTQWKFTGSIAGLKEVTDICFVIYTKKKATLGLSNLRLTAE